MNSLGGLYDNGQGVPRNYATARACYEKAAAAGVADAKTALARLGNKRQ
jgi:TPR repeat protein